MATKALAENATLLEISLDDVMSVSVRVLML